MAINGSSLLTVLSIPLCITYVLAIFGIRLRPRIGFAVSMIVSALSLVVLGALGFIVPSLGAPVNALSFVFTLTTYPALLIAAVYSILGFRRYSKQLTKSVGSTPTIARYNVWGIFIVGFIIGGLIIGGIAGTLESRLLSDNAPADITIVMGSAFPNNSQSYSPPTLSVRVGQTITWVNRDSSIHSVTSVTEHF